MMLAMIRPRTVLLIGAISLVFGWWAGTMMSPASQEAPAQHQTGLRPLL